LHPPARSNSKRASSSDAQRKESVVAAAAPAMRIFCLSDLHLEFYGQKATFSEFWARFLKPKLTTVAAVADMLILAGDIGYPYPKESMHAQNYRQFLKNCREMFPHVLVVPGNHEYYAGGNLNPTADSRAMILKALRDICQDTGAILLQQNSISIAGIRFLGTTLWSDIQKPAFKAMNDSRYVFDTVQDYQKAFRDDYAWLCRELTPPPTVIITHHLPTKRLIHPRFRDSSFHSGFVTDILEPMDEKGLLTPLTRYWFCGHSHERVKVNFGELTLYLNPLGYPHEATQRYTEPNFETVFVV